jgi:hypothetical protein
MGKRPATPQGNRPHTIPHRCQRTTREPCPGRAAGDGTLSVRVPG